MIKTAIASISLEKVVYYIIADSIRNILITEEEIKQASAKEAVNRKANIIILKRGFIGSISPL